MVGVEIDLKALVTKDDMHKALRDHHDRMGGRKQVPNYRTLFASGVVANNVLQLELGRPMPGRIWYLSAITMVGADDHTAVAGTAAVYGTDIAGQSLAGLIVPGAVIPNQTSYAAWVMMIYPSEGLSVSLVGGTNGQVLTVLAKVVEWVDIPGEILPAKF